MSTDTDIKRKPLSGLFTFLSLIFFLGGFYLVDSMFLASKPWYLRLGIAVLSLVLAVFALTLTKRWQYLSSLAKGARIELRKVFWPKKDELLKTTGLVLIIVTVFSICLWTVDAILTLIIQWVL